jgi:hypothetical protein
MYSIDAEINLHKLEIRQYQRIPKDYQWSAVYQQRRRYSR